MSTHSATVSLVPAPSDHESRPGRASRLPPEERRAAIIAATIPLIRAYGYSVTTRQIADASGVGEGTLFRVFEDKNHLIREAICVALEPTGLVERIAAIDRDRPVRVRLTDAIDLLQQRMKDVFELLAAVQMYRPPGGDTTVRPPSHEPIVRSIEELIEPDRAAFRVEPAEIARMLQVLTFAGSHSGINDDHPMTPEQIVSILLDGVLQPSSRP